ncbi:uncharacterized protein dnajc30a [Paramisgurnus dabryanus]|uniref:uncharacterized protein dnajc30a n=1 Tax=Paramisgurnus dabryanus TaxID=90735 RepID=UPI0031F46FDF
MAEVRIRFGRSAYKCLKPSYQAIWDKESKAILKGSYVAALINSPRFCATENDRVEVDHGADKICRVCLHTPKLKSSETSSRVFTYLKVGDGYPGTLDFLTENTSGNIRTDYVGLEAKADCLTPVEGSSCLETHVKLPIYSNAGNHQFKRQLRRSIYTGTLYGRSHPRIGQFTSFARAYGKKHNNGNPVPLYKSKSAYYDILEVSPTATHAQIKTAYYKQSFKYHPDKNAGSEEATFHFAQISEAYSVLGNKALKRKYDHGILSQEDLLRSGRPTGKDSTASPSGQQTRSRQSPSVGGDQQNIFDFDTFIRAHYGEQLQRERELRQLKEKIRQKQNKQFEDVKLGRMKEVAVGMLLVMAVSIVLSLSSND